MTLHYNFPQAGRLPWNEDALPTMHYRACDCFSDIISSGIHASAGTILKYFNYNTILHRTYRMRVVIGLKRIGPMTHLDTYL